MKAFLEKLAAVLHQGLEKKFLVLNAMFAFLLFILFPCLIFLRGANMLFQSSGIRKNLIRHQQAENLLDRCLFMHVTISFLTVFFSESATRTSPEKDH